MHSIQKFSPLLSYFQKSEMIQVSLSSQVWRVSWSVQVLMTDDFLFRIDLHAQFFLYFNSVLSPVLLNRNENDRAFDAEPIDMRYVITLLNFRGIIIWIESKKKQDLSKDFWKEKYFRNYCFIKLQLEIVNSISKDSK